MFGLPMRRWTSRTLPLAIAVTLFANAAAQTAAQTAEVRRLFNAGQYDRAELVARVAMQRGFSNDQGALWVIRSQMTTGRYAEALATYRDAVRRHPTSLALRYEGLDVLRFNDSNDEVLAAQADLAEQLQRSLSRYIARDDLIAAGRFLTDRGEDARKVLELFYDRVLSRDPTFLPAQLATAELAISKGDFKVAAKTLQTAIEQQPTDPQPHYLLGLAYESGDRAAATGAVQTALRLNPRHPGALRWTAERLIDAEKYDAADREIDKALEVNPNDALAHALRAVIAHLRGRYDLERQHRRDALSSWPQNPGVDHLIGKKLSQHYRFAEGAAYQNRALELDPSHVPARFQLAQDRLRLGDEAIGWELAGEVGKDDPYNVVAYNLLTLRDKTRGFTVLQRDGIRVRMQDREAKLYGPEVLDLLSEAKAVLGRKYEVDIDKTVLVEIFPQQDDFAIRTFGLPGGAGYLGVCFGRVITANSPASQGQRPANWQSVLWHEFAHVVTLEKTQNRMPRWLSEGISVHEERQRDASWGETITPAYRSMMLGEDLTPVSQLSGSFMSPKSPLHVQFAYYESSLVVEYLIEQHGFDSLLAVLDDLGRGMSINDALARHIGPIDQLDEQFRQYATRVAGEYGGAADWSRDGLPNEEADADVWKGWVRMHPTHYWGLRSAAKALMRENRWAEADAMLDRLASLGALTAGRDGPLEWSAIVAAELGERDAERRALRQIVAQSADALPALGRQIEMEQAAGGWAAMLAAARGALAIQPLLPEFHAAAALAAQRLGETEVATRALTALLATDPIDPAGLHHQVADVLAAAEPLTPADRSLAKRHVLMALELAPRYREAHRLLLQLTRQEDRDRAEVIEVIEVAGETPAAEPTP